MRYEIVLPVAGSYAQIRDFLKRALAEIPVLSVDQLTLKRDEPQRRRDPGRAAPHPPHGEVMKLSLNLSPWKKNAAIIAAAVTVVAGVVAGREKPVAGAHSGEAARPVADDGIDLAKLQRPEATVPQNDPFARNFGQPKPAQVAGRCRKSRRRRRCRSATSAG